MTDQDRDQSSSGDSLGRVLQIFKEIAEKSADGDYIYRGEPEHYCRVSSSLYRRREEIKIEGLDIEIAQAEMLKSAQEFAGQMDEDDLLAQLQHYGSVTNLIDFTTDYLIALFFACDGKPAKDGRVILLKRSSYPLLEPKSPANRVIAQKSVFVRPPEGFIDDRKTKIVSVPLDLKQAILEHLGKHHNVRAQTIYNDLHGFIRYHEGNESAYLEFYAAEAHVRKREYEAAIDRYSNAIKLNPQLTPAYNNRGNVYKDKGDYDRAIQDYDKAIELNPNLAAAYTNRGVVHIRKRRYGSAFQDYDRAIELDPRYAEAYYNRGNAFSELDKFDCAIRDYDKAIELDPQYAAAYTNRGIAYMKKGDLSHAVQDLTDAIDLDPGNALAYNNRGVAFARKGDLDHAIQDHSKAMEINRRYAAAYTNRGTAYMDKGDFDRAIQDHSEAIKLEPNNAAFYSNLGLAYANKGEHVRAIKDYDKAIKLDSRLGNAYYNRGECWLVLNEWAKAEADLSKAKSLGVDVVSAFREEFGSVAAFEERYKVRLPASIAPMLVPGSDE